MPPLFPSMEEFDLNIKKEINKFQKRQTKVVD